MQLVLWWLYLFANYALHNSICIHAGSLHSFQKVHHQFWSTPSHAVHMYYINNWLRIFLPWLIAVRIHINSCVYTCKLYLGYSHFARKGWGLMSPSWCCACTDLPLCREKHDEMKTQFVAATGQDIIAGNTVLRFHFPTRRLIENTWTRKKYSNRSEKKKRKKGKKCKDGEREKCKEVKDSRVSAS